MCSQEITQLKIIGSGLPRTKTKKSRFLDNMSPHNKFYNIASK